MKEAGMTESVRLMGKRALVTGGSRGIGAAIVRRLAAEGAAVAVNYVADASSADKLVAELTDKGHRRSAGLTTSAIAFSVLCNHAMLAMYAIIERWQRRLRCVCLMTNMTWSSGTLRTTVSR
jgi:NAD(P)-dependent dehydrogenase (short-subunit alcohol dehydrogenase family)